MIGIFGGTFNPIHKGHLQVLQALHTQLEFETLYVMPAATPPHKDLPKVSAQHRLAMLELAISEWAWLSIDRQELHRVGRSYTFDSLIALRKNFGNTTALCWIVGQDAFAGLETWYRATELFDYCHFVVVMRSPAIALSQYMQGVLDMRCVSYGAQLRHTASGAIWLTEVGALPVSSTQIRQALAQGQDVSAYLPARVAEYIAQHKLYVATACT